VNVEFLQLCGVEDKPGLQVNLNTIVECLFGLASGFFTLLPKDIGVGIVDSQLSENLFPQELLTLREVAPIELEGFFNGLGMFFFSFLILEFGSIHSRV
jgi:hypothetical protein